MEKLNKVQMEILTKLMTLEHARFRDLNIQGLPSDQFTFHINKLKALGLIFKNSLGLYEFTEKGISFITTVDHLSATIEKQSLLVVMMICVREINDHFEYLVQKRTKQPDINYYTFPSGKTKYGSKFEEEALRELKEETGLYGNLTLTDISHIIKYKDTQNNIFRDLILYTYRVEDTNGELMHTEEGENIWITLDEYLKLDKTYTSNTRILKNIHCNQVSIHEEIIAME